MNRNGQAVLLPSPLGLTLTGADFSRDLKLVNTSPVKAISDRYSMAVGKRSAIQYRANEQVYSLVNAAGHKMNVAFRVSDDGVAFRYVVADARSPAKRPGSHVVVARKAGSSWYVAGINADQSERTVELDLSFIGNRKGAMITDGAGQREFSQAELQGGKVRVTLQPRGGFVAVFR